MLRLNIAVIRILIFFALVSAYTGADQYLRTDAAPGDPAISRKAKLELCNFQRNSFVEVQRHQRKDAYFSTFCVRVPWTEMYPILFQRTVMIYENTFKNMRIGVNPPGDKGRITNTLLHQYPPASKDFLNQVGIVDDVLANWSKHGQNWNEIVEMSCPHQSKYIFLQCQRSPAIDVNSESPIYLSAKWSRSWHSLYGRRTMDEKLKLSPIFKGYEEPPEEPGEILDMVIDDIEEVEEAPVVIVAPPPPPPVSKDYITLKHVSSKPSKNNQIATFVSFTPLSDGLRRRDEELLYDVYKLCRIKVEITLVDLDGLPAGSVLNDGTLRFLLTLEDEYIREPAPGEVETEAKLQKIPLGEITTIFQNANTSSGASSYSLKVADSIELVDNCRRVNSFAEIDPGGRSAKITAIIQITNPTIRTQYPHRHTIKTTLTIIGSDFVLPSVAQISLKADPKISVRPVASNQPLQLDMTPEFKSTCAKEEPRFWNEPFKIRLREESVKKHLNVSLPGPYDCKYVNKAPIELIVSFHILKNKVPCYEAPFNFFMDVTGNVTKTRNFLATWFDPMEYDFVESCYKKVDREKNHFHVKISHEPNKHLALSRFPNEWTQFIVIENFGVFHQMYLREIRDLAEILEQMELRMRADRTLNLFHKSPGHKLTKKRGEMRTQSFQKFRTKTGWPQTIQN